ncbi:MAG: CvpA family protein [Nevskiales bacterium]|nr:CvpA family protein [Nevskiales bacterium]
MTWVDYSILFLFALSVLVGIWRGFTREILSLLTWVVAFIAAALAGSYAAARLSAYIADAALREAAGCAIVFLGALFVGAVLTHFLVVAVRDSRFSPADRTLGGGLGLIRAVIIVSLFVLVAGQVGAQNDRWWQESVLVPRFAPLANGFENIIPQRWLELIKPAPPSST